MTQLRFFQSRDIRDYGPVIEGLLPDFGYIFSYEMLRWCGVVPRRPENEGKFWEVWLAEQDGKTAGVCGLYTQYRGRIDELWLGWFGVLPQRRGAGLGAEMLAWMEKEAASRGCRAICSYVPAAGRALPFYLRSGYERVCTVAEYLRDHPELDKSLFEDEGGDHVIRKKMA